MSWASETLYIFSNNEKANGFLFFSTIFIFFCYRYNDDDEYNAQLCAFTLKNKLKVNDNHIVQRFISHL